MLHRFASLFSQIHHAHSMSRSFSPRSKHPAISMRVRKLLENRAELILCMAELRKKHGFDWVQNWFIDVELRGIKR